MPDDLNESDRQKTHRHSRRGRQLRSVDRSHERHPFRNDKQRRNSLTVDVQQVRALSAEGQIASLSGPPLSSPRAARLARSDDEAAARNADGDRLRQAPFAGLAVLADLPLRRRQQPPDQAQQPRHAVRPQGLPPRRAQYRMITGSIPLRVTVQLGHFLPSQSPATSDCLRFASGPSGADELMTVYGTHLPSDGISASVGDRRQTGPIAGTVESTRISVTGAFYG